MKNWQKIISIILIFISIAAVKTSKKNHCLLLVKQISGNLTPKSVVHSGNGLFFTQNMMYKHSVCVYNRDFNLIKTIKDKVNLSDFGLNNYTGEYQGSPVEAAFTPDGQYAYISNYEMYGKGFDAPGFDKCKQNEQYDNSFLYKINTKTLNIDKIISTGSVPKFVATTPNNKYVLVSNWCSSDVSIISIENDTEIKRIPVGAYPRGIVVDSVSSTAYIALMGATKIAKIDLNNFTVSYITSIGNSPRHLCIHYPFLYATLNGEGKVAKINLINNKLIKKINTGKAPRSMCISNDGNTLYVVNYLSNTISKINTAEMKVLDEVKTNEHPIGITFDELTANVWVACYSGSIMVFNDTNFTINPEPNLAADTSLPLLSLPKVNSTNNTIKNISPSVNLGLQNLKNINNNVVKNESYFIIVASLDNVFKAKKEAKTWYKKGGDEVQILAAPTGKYRVSFDCLDNETDANKRLALVKHLKPDAWVLKY